MLSKAEIEKELEAVVGFIEECPNVETRIVAHNYRKALETALALYEENQEARQLLEQMVNVYPDLWPNELHEAVSAFLKEDNKRRGGGFDAG